MWEAVSNTTGDYYRFYTSYGVQRWNNMSPMEYGTILIMIGVLGWFMMRNAVRR